MKLNRSMQTAVEAISACRSVCRRSHLRLMAVGVASLFLTGSALAQTPFTGAFTFTGTTGNTNSFAYNGTPILNLTVGNLSKNSLPTSSSSGNFRSSNWALDPSVGSLTGTVNLTQYYEFTLTASPGYTFNLASLDFGLGRSATGPRSFQWRSSVDSYAAPIASYSTVSGSVTNTAGVLTTPDSTTGYTGNVLAMSGSSSSYAGLGAVTLRFYGYNSEATAGTGGLQGPLTFAGSLAGSAGTAYTWAGGSGNWENGQSGAFGQAYANSPTATATFSGASGTVTVTGTVEVATMAVDSSGYSFQGGSISLASAAIAVNAASAQVASQISGTSGLVKSGTGSLTLSGTNTYTGLTNISGGRLVIAADSALGDAANDLSLSGTLATTASLTLGVDRALTGAGTLDIAPGTTLTSNGSFGLTSTTLSNGGTLDLQGATRSVGTLTFGTAATVNGSGAISLSGLTATAVTSGSAIVNPAITFTSNGDKTVDVGSGGTLVLNGDVAGTTGRIAKTGAGTLIASGTNTTSGFRLGATGTTPTDGGKVILTTAAASGTGTQLQVNYGTLEAAAPLTLANGLSIGGRSNGVAVVGGTNAITFSGSTAFFRGTNTSGELRLDVNNVTTFGGVLGATGGSGSATGVTFGGTGRLILAGDGSAFTDRVAVGSGLTLELANATSLAGATLDTSTGTIAYGVASTSVGGLTGSGTLALPTTNLTAGGNNASTTFSGRLTGAGAFTKSGTGTLTLTGANDYSGATTVQAGRLAVNGSLPQTASVTVAGGAELGGAGSVGTSVSGAGAIGPGNSPGILTAPSVTPSGGLGFNFEITGTAPDFTTASASVNDVLRLTNTSTPLLSLLTGSNAMNIYFDDAQFGTPGRIYQAGIFVDATTAQFASFLDAVDSAAFSYFVRTTGTSFDVTYAGNNYLTLANWNTSQSLGVSVNLGTTTVPSAAFSGGTVTNGQIMTFEAVPEPSALVLAGIGVAAAGYLARKRRRPE